MTLTVRIQPAALYALKAPRWGRVARQFSYEIFSLEENLQDKVGGFQIEKGRETEKTSGV